MGSSKAVEVDIEDVFSDTKLELDEIDSTISILCCALENPQYEKPEIENIGNILFMLQGKLSIIKNNIRILQSNIKT